jgi:hypothetical protein
MEQTYILILLLLVLINFIVISEGFSIGSARTIAPLRPDFCSDLRFTASPRSRDNRRERDRAVRRCERALPKFERHQRCEPRDWSGHGYYDIKCLPVTPEYEDTDSDYDGY